MSGTEVHLIDIEMLGNLVEGVVTQSSGNTHDQEYHSCDGSTPRASRSATPAQEMEENRGGDDPDTENCGSRTGDTDSQYESDTSSVAPGPPPTQNKNAKRSDFATRNGNAIRRIMRANKITKASTLTHMNTRNQGEAATKASIKEATSEVRELRQVVFQLFNALAEKEELDGKRWEGFHEEWTKEKAKVKEMAGEIEAIRGYDEETGYNWFDNMDKRIVTIGKIQDKAKNTCKDVGNTCRRTRMDFLCFICSFVIAAMLDRRGFAC